MRLSTRIHGYIDYALGAVLLILPWVGGFGGSPAGWTAMAGGLVTLGLTLVTNFEAGVLKRVEVPLHLWIDGVLGLLLALSPWLLGFDRTVWIPHVAAGIAIMLFALFTDTVPARDRRRAESRVA